MSIYFFLSLLNTNCLFFLQTPIVVFYGGKWNECNVYENYSVAKILVDVRISFNCLVGLIYKEIELDE